MWQDTSVSEDHAALILYWRWKQQCPPKRWYPATYLHGVTTAKRSRNVF